MRLATIASLSGVVSCGEHTTIPNERRSTPNVQLLRVVSGDSQMQIAAQMLAKPLVIRVTDTDGRPIRGIAVLFTTVNGGYFSESARSVSDGDGRISSVWTLGPLAGEQFASVTLTYGDNGSAAQTFRATALPDSPSQLDLLVADSAEAPPAPRISFTLSARVRDRHGNVVPGVVVRWLRPTFGFVQAESTLSDREGKAVTKWIMESQVGDITPSWDYYSLTVRVDDVRARDMAPRTIHRRVAVTPARAALPGTWRAERWEFFEDPGMTSLIQDVMADGMSGTMTIAAAEGEEFHWYWRERYRWWGPENGTDIFGRLWLNGEGIVATVTGGFSKLECDWGDCDGPLHGHYDVAFEGSLLVLTRREAVGYYAVRGPLRAWSRLTLGRSSNPAVTAGDKGQ